MKKRLVTIIGLIMILTIALASLASAAPKSTIAFTVRQLTEPYNEILYTMNQNGDNQKKILSADSFDRLAFSTSGNDDLAISYETDKDKNYLAILDSSQTIYRKITLSSWTGQPSWYEGKIIYGVYYDGIYQYDPVTDLNSQIIHSSISTYDHSPIIVGDNLYFNHSEWGTHCYVISLPDWSLYIGRPILGPGWGYLDPSEPPDLPFVRVLPNSTTGDSDTNMQYNSTSEVFINSADIIRYIVGSSQPQTLKMPSGIKRTTHAYLSNDGRKIVYGTNKGIYVTSLVGRIITKKISKMIVIENGSSNSIIWSPKDNLIAVNKWDGIYLVGALSKTYQHRIYKLDQTSNHDLDRIAWSH